MMPTGSHGEGERALRRRVHGAVVLVGPGAVAEQPLDGGIHFPLRGLGFAAGHGAQPLGELVAARGQVLGDVVDDLGPRVRCRFRPALGLARGLDGVADVLAAAGTDQAEVTALGADHRQRMAAVRPRLLAADVHLRRAVDGIAGRRSGGGRRGLGLQRRHLRLVGRLQVFEQALAAAFAAEAGLAVAAEADGGVELVAAVDPDHAGLQRRRHVERRVDVLAPDAGGEAVARVVGQLDRLLRCAEAHRHQHRAEDLLAGDGGGGLDPGQQGRRIEVAGRGKRVRRLVQLGALLETGGDQGFDAP